MTAMMMTQTTVNISCTLAVTKHSFKWPKRISEFDPYHNPMKKVVSLSHFKEKEAEGISESSGHLSSVTQLTGGRARVGNMVCLDPRA